MMLLIVATHFAHPICTEFQNATTSVHIFDIFLTSWGKTGINSFILISSYFMCVQNFKVSKFLKLLCEIYFYNIFIGLIYLSTHIDGFSLKDIVSICFPFRVNDIHHFNTPFLIFYVLTPFLKIMVSNLNKRQHRLLICILLFSYVFYGLPKLSVDLDAVAWFSTLFIIASYLRFYADDFAKLTPKILSILTLILLILCFLSEITLLKIGHTVQVLVADGNSLFAVSISIVSFMLFSKIKVKTNKIINGIASTTFGVLLIHTNPYIGHWLWNEVVDSQKWYYSTNYMGYIMPLFYILAIFCVCSAIDYVRIKLIEPRYLPVIQRIFKVK